MKACASKRVPQGVHACWLSTLQLTATAYPRSNVEESYSNQTLLFVTQLFWAPGTASATRPASRNCIRQNIPKSACVESEPKQKARKAVILLVGFVRTGPSFMLLANLSSLHSRLNTVHGEQVGLA